MLTSPCWAWLSRQSRGLRGRRNNPYPCQNTICGPPRSTWICVDPTHTNKMLGAQRCVYPYHTYVLGSSAAYHVLVSWHCPVPFANPPSDVCTERSEPGRRSATKMLRISIFYSTRFLSVWQLRRTTAAVSVQQGGPSLTQMMIKMFLFCKDGYCIRSSVLAVTRTKTVNEDWILGAYRR